MQASMQSQEQAQLKLNQAEETQRVWSEAVEVAIQQLADINAKRAETDESELTSTEQETAQRQFVKAEQAPSRPPESSILQEWRSR